MHADETDATDILYFGYGSNLNRDDLARYCARHGDDPDSLQPQRPAWLLDHRPAYHYFSAGRKGGALDVVPALGQVMPGVLFAVAPDGWSLLDRKEGAPSCYARHPIYALDTQGGLREDRLRAPQALV